MPTNKQRRQAAQRHLQRQLERRAELARKRRRNLGILVTALAVVVVVGRGAAAHRRVRRRRRHQRRRRHHLGRRAHDAAPRRPPRTPTARSAAPTAPTTRATRTSPTSARRPTPEATPTQGTVTLLMSTDQGDLTLTLDRAKAPCAAASFAYLAAQKFFDGSPCHREVNQPSLRRPAVRRPDRHRLGRPDATSSPRRSPPETTYPRGTIAMANTGAPELDRQPVLPVLRRHPAQPGLHRRSAPSTRPASPCWTQIAAAGNDGSFEAPAPGGGAPEPSRSPIKSMTVVGLSDR